MTTQVTVRLPDALVHAVDALVGSGQARSRASVVERALERELRRVIAERDISILRDEPVADDLDALASWTLAHHADLG